MKYLGIDYGKKKVGLAISEGQIASVYKVLEVSSLKDALEKVNQVVKKESINRVVVGLPEGREARSMTKSFIKGLKKRFKDQVVEVIETDETLTSLDAKRLMIEMNVARKKRRDEDAYSAALILQNFLNSLS